MRPGNEGAYSSTLVACFACAEAERMKRDLNEGGDTEPGLRIHVTKT